MKQIKDSSTTYTFEELSKSISEINLFFLKRAQQQVNTALTIRNWLIGFYIVEYEHLGNDRAKYGAKLYKAIAEKLLQMGVKSIRERHLYLCKDLYQAYPQILRTVSAKSFLKNFQKGKILRTLSAESGLSNKQIDDTNLLLIKISFSHFIELLKVNEQVQRKFYELQTVNNNWSVRDLKRAIESLLYERTGISENKKLVTKNFNQENEIKQNIFLKILTCWNFLNLKKERNIRNQILNNELSVTSSIFSWNLVGAFASSIAKNALRLEINITILTLFFIIEF